jgi:hypothetical protein
MGHLSITHIFALPRMLPGIRPALRGGDGWGLAFPGFRPLKRTSPWAIIDRSSGAEDSRVSAILVTYGGVSRDSWSWARFSSLFYGKTGLWVIERWVMATQDDKSFLALAARLKSCPDTSCTLHAILQEAQEAAEKLRKKGESGA